MLSLDRWRQFSSLIDFYYITSDQTNEAQRRPKYFFLSLRYMFTQTVRWSLHAFSFANERCFITKMLLLLVFLLLTLAFVYVKLKYFTLYGPIPGKPPQFLVGNLLQTGLARGKYLGDVARDLQATYGDTFQVWLSVLHVISVCHPDDVQHIFAHRHIYEQGDLHITQHRILFNDALICNIGSLTNAESNVGYHSSP